jgi:hypothetical protein
MPAAVMAETAATIIAEWPLNRRERLRVSIEQYNGTWLFNVRRWFEADDGSMRPGKRGFAIGVKHLPQIAEATAKALAQARARGLIHDAAAEGTRT